MARLTLLYLRCFTVCLGREVTYRAGDGDGKSWIAGGGPAPDDLDLFLRAGVTLGGAPDYGGFSRCRCGDPLMFWEYPYHNLCVWIIFDRRRRRLSASLSRLSPHCRSGVGSAGRPPPNITEPSFGCRYNSDGICRAEPGAISRIETNGTVLINRSLCCFDHGHSLASRAADARFRALA